MTVPETVHQAKFSMGTVLGLIANGGVAGLTEFEGVLARDDVASFRDRVTMVLDPEVDAAYPARWIGKVVVETTDGRRIEARVDDPKGDPTNTLSREELTAKARSLIRFGGRSDDEALVQRLWHVGELNHVGALAS